MSQHDQQPNAEDSARCAALTGSGSARDWLEDAAHENGNYQCRCLQCKQTFIGHKRRYVCKICDEENRVKWAAMSEEERNALRAQRESEYIHFCLGVPNMARKSQNRDLDGINSV